MRFLITVRAQASLLLGVAGSGLLAFVGGLDSAQLFMVHGVLAVFGHLLFQSIFLGLGETERSPGEEVMNIHVIEAIKELVEDHVILIADLSLAATCHFELAASCSNSHTSREVSHWLTLLLFHVVELNDIR